MKVTKKMFNEANNYMVLIDYKAGLKPDLEAVKLEAETIFEAMTEAEKKFNDTVYLISVFEKQNIVEEEKIIYKEVITTRGNGWHATDGEHSEVPYKYGFYPEFDTFECMGAWNGRGY